MRCSSALLGAASLKPTACCRDGVICGRFFRPIGGGIIEASFGSIQTGRIAGRSSALLGAASLKRTSRTVRPALSSTFFRPIGGGIIEAVDCCFVVAAVDLVLPPYWGRHH